MRDTCILQDTCKIHAGYMQDTSGYVLYRKPPPICIGNPPAPIPVVPIGPLLAAASAAAARTRERRGGVTPVSSSCTRLSYSAGIGVFFYTRKGSFLYKISLYIITYHVAIIVYHCVSLSISQYIMSLGDTWYQWYRWYIMHDMIYHDIWCSFWTHDTNMISQKIKLWYTAKKYHVPYHAASVSCFGINDIWTWYRSGMTWDMRWQTIFTFLLFYDIINISISIMWYHVISCGIMWYHVIFSIMWYQQYHVYHVISYEISCDIMWYQACESRRPQRERFSNPVETFLTTWGEGWSLHLPHRPSCQPPCRKVPHTNPT